MGFHKQLGYLKTVMRTCNESFAATLAPLVGALLLCAGISTSAYAAPNVPARSKLQPRLVPDAEPVGFRAKTQQLVLQPINLDVSRFAFTAPGRVTSSRPQAVERSFSFTPSGSGRNGVSLGVTTRTVSVPQSERSAAIDPGITPAGYNFDLSVGYRGLAVTGGLSRVDTGLGGHSREGVDVGLRYGTRKWQAGIAAMAERDTGYLVPRGGTPDPMYAVEASGNVNLSPKVSLGGSLRYRPAPTNPTTLDPNRDDRAVMVGGAVAF